MVDEQKNIENNSVPKPVSAKFIDDFKKDVKKINIKKVEDEEN